MWSGVYSGKTTKQSIPVITTWQLNERMYVAMPLFLFIVCVNDESQNDVVLAINTGDVMLQDAISEKLGNIVHYMATILVRITTQSSPVPEIFGSFGFLPDLLLWSYMAFTVVCFVLFILFKILLCNYDSLLLEFPSRFRSIDYEFLVDTMNLT
ncbi:uncharacterized protein LOC131656711 [Vicia villosa]|uniref:uncharacterized protein LOC131656711 n=1 Tax=Vicia villosa TaxID=3911 RepID=UPI00273A90A4|nr:uncharacterized protein LOC131656711 [Vicia villosa]